MNGAYSGVPDWRRSLPNLPLLFVVVAWGLNFSVIKIAYQSVSPQTVAIFRYLAMAPLLVAVCLVFRAPLKCERQDVWRLLTAGFISSGVYMVLFLEGMKTTGAAEGAIALATAPVFISIFAVMARQELFTWRLLVGSILAFAGVSVVIVAGAGKVGGDTFGTSLVLGSAVLWAYSVILMKPLLGKYSPFTVMTLSFPGAALALLPYGWSSLVSQDWSAVTPAGWFALIYLVAIAGVAAFIAYYAGLAQVGPARTSLTQFFIPPTAALGSALLLKTSLNLWQAVGLAIVIGGVALASRGRKLLGREEIKAVPGMEPICEATSAPEAVPEPERA